MRGAVADLMLGLSLVALLVVAALRGDFAPTASTEPRLRMHGAAERARKVADFLAAARADDATGAEPARLLVTTLADDGDGSLRAAINAANARPGMALIEFDPALEGIIELSSGPLHITDSVAVAGPGADRLGISGMSRHRVVALSNPARTPDVLLVGLTLSEGLDATGAGIFSYGANLSLSDCVIAGNVARDPLRPGIGGGIYHAEGKLRIDRCAVSHNRADDRGGGIATIDSSASIEESMISGNLAETGGGAYVDTSASFTMQRTLVSGNQAGKRGAGLHLFARESASARIGNSTVSGNIAMGDGGAGIYARGSLEISLSTVVDNRQFAVGLPRTAAAGIQFDGHDGRLRLQGVVASGNSVLDTPADVGRTSGVIDACACLIHASAAGAVNGEVHRTRFGVDPLLGPLADNGGPTPTYAITAGGPPPDAGCDVAGLRADRRDEGFAPRVEPWSGLPAWMHANSPLSKQFRAPPILPRDAARLNRN